MKKRAEEDLSKIKRLLGSKKYNQLVLKHKKKYSDMEEELNSTLKKMENNPFSYYNLTNKIEYILVNLCIFAVLVYSFNRVYVVLGQTITAFFFALGIELIIALFLKVITESQKSLKNKGVLHSILFCTCLYDILF